MYDTLLTHSGATVHFSGPPFTQKQWTNSVHSQYGNRFVIHLIEWTVHSVKTTTTMVFVKDCINVLSTM